MFRLDNSETRQGLRVFGGISRDYLQLQVRLFTPNFIPREEFISPDRRSAVDPSSPSVAQGDLRALGRIRRDPLPCAALIFGEA